MRNYVILILSVLSLIQFSCTKQVSDTSRSNTTEKTTKVEPEQKIKEVQEVQIEGAQTDEESPERYYELGAEAHNLGNYKEAINYFTKCISLDKNYPGAMGFRGISKMKSGDLEGACQDWENAKKTGYAPSDKLIQDFCK